METQKEKNVHHHLALVSRVNMFFSIAAFIVVLLLGAWMLLSGQMSGKGVIEGLKGKTEAVSEREAVIVTPDEAAIDTTYRTELNALLEGYNFDDSATAEKKIFAALELRAPAELKNVQLEVVLALREAQGGKFTEAQQRMADLKKNHGWLQN
jgi:hypothetical protein